MKTKGQILEQMRLLRGLRAGSPQYDGFMRDVYQRITWQLETLERLINKTEDQIQDALDEIYYATMQMDDPKVIACEWVLGLRDYPLASADDPVVAKGLKMLKEAKAAQKTPA